MSAATDSSALPRRAVVVLGMHRSGTSAVAGCLHRLGVDFGPRLMPATEDNARGYFEHIDIVNLHDRLLLALDSSWDEIRPLPPGWSQDDARTGRYRAELLELLQRDLPTAPLWGIKDPRLCRLLPWWEPVWAATGSRPLFVIVRRSPSEVAASLARREGFSIAKSHLLWLLHTVEAERATRFGPRVFVEFKDFLSDWRAALEPVRAALGRPWPTPSAEAFIDPALIRSAATASDTSLPRWVAQADAALRTGQEGREAEMHETLDRLDDMLAAAGELYGRSDVEREADLHQQLAATRRQARWYEAEWHKARRRAESIQRKLPIKPAVAPEPEGGIINIESNKSNTIINKISFMRNLWGVLGRYLRRATMLL